jgi:uncharacterized protein (TIGR03382 family)
MRSLLIVVPVLLASIACGAASAEDDLAAAETSELKSAGSCSREKVLAAASSGRRRALQRGFKWLDENVPYSQSGSHGGYRTDCSGFVSMCWELGKSSNTGALVSGDANSRLSSFDDLIPADALLRSGHVMMFAGWSDAAHTGACVLEQSSTKNDMQFRVRSTASLRSEGYKPIRAKKLANDRGVGAGTAAEDDEPSAEESEEDELAVARQPPRRETPGACTPFSPDEACGVAFEERGFECGMVSDGCGGVINCDRVPTFGCGATETCSPDHRCTAPTCVPKTAAEVCAAAKASSGVECGTVPNGCGGTVSCDTVTSFGCTAPSTCGTTNRCEKKAPATTEVAIAQPESAAADSDEGDTGDESKPSSAKDDKAADKPAKKAAEGGCNASSQNPIGDALPFIALVLAAGMVRRRSRRARAA